MDKNSEKTAVTIVILITHNLKTPKHAILRVLLGEKTLICKIKPNFWKLVILFYNYHREHQVTFNSRFYTSLKWKWL